MKKKYILLKDSPELKKGAILEEKCDGGNQGFECISLQQHRKADDQNGCSYSRKTIMEQPQWFEEVTLVYLTKQQLKKIGYKIREIFTT